MKKLNNPAPPPTFEQLLEVFRRTTPKDFYEPLADRGDGTPTPSFSLFRGLARTFEKLALKATRSVEARYFLPSAIQRDEPASSGRPAQGYVDVRRVGQSTDALVIDPGRMRLEGPGGRFYVNADPVVWNPGDTATRRLLFVSEVEGFAGNLDHLADEAGLLDLDLVSIADQDLDRAATNGSILVPSGSVLQDSGIPDLFGPADVGLYARINAAANPANVGRQLRIVGFDWPQLEIPVGTGRYPRRVTLDDVERRNPIEVLLDDGGVVTDFYSEAVDELGTNDVPALPPVPAIGDAFYVATTAPFNKVSLRFDTPGDGDWTIAVRYWDGVAWVDVSDLDDPTNGLRPSSSGFYDVAWTLPADWAPVASPSGSGLVPYLLRFEVTGFVSVAQQPLLGRVVLHVPSPLIAEDASVTWSLLDFDTLGLELTRVEAFANGRDNDLYMLGDARGVYQQAGESDDVFRDRASRLAEVVSPLAIIRVVNRALRPYGYAGKAFDVTIDTTPDNSLAGAGFTGLFCDVDPALAPDLVAAFDLYGAGDLYPKDPWLVLQSKEEAYGWFIVALPYLGQGDFGIYLDDGPLYFDADVQVYYGPSLNGFMDGFAVEGEATYSAIHSALSTIKAGGVGFTFVRRKDLTTPGAC